MIFSMPYSQQQSYHLLQLSESPPSYNATTHAFTDFTSEFTLSNFQIYPSKLEICISLSQTSTMHSSDSFAITPRARTSQLGSAIHTIDVRIAWSITEERCLPKCISPIDHIMSANPRLPQLLTPDKSKASARSYVKAYQSL